MDLFVILLVSFLALLIWVFITSNKYKKEKDIENEYIAFNQSVQSEYEKLIDGTSVYEFVSDIPFRIKEGENFFFCKSATQGQTKRDGSFGYGALTTNIRVAPGVNIRVGSGKLAMDESWVYDQQGILCISNKRLVFCSETRNTTINLEKIMDWGYFSDEGILHIGKETGKNMRYDIDGAMTPKEVALFSLVIDGDVVVE